MELGGKYDEHMKRIIHSVLENELCNVRTVCSLLSTCQL
jgi:hypothetical protein